MSANANVSMAEFFGWKHHPFSDTYTITPPFLAQSDERLCQRSLSLLNYGKSFAFQGPSGNGKTTLLQHIISCLDPNHYQSILIHYGGLRRSGILKAIADNLGVEVSGHKIPLLVKLQKHIFERSTQTKSIYPIFIIDDAQLMERDSFMDLCSLVIRPQKKTVASSIILVGDETLANILQLHAMTPIRTRLTGTFHVKALDDRESDEFIMFRLDAAKAPKQLFDKDAITLIAAHCHGNRRQIMNVGTLLIEEAFFRQEKTIGAQLIFECDALDFAE